MLPKDVCTMPKDDGGLGLLDVTTQGNTLVTKWVMRCFEGSAPWQVLFPHQIITTQYIGRV